MVHSVLFAIVAVLGALVSGCWGYQHKTKVENGNVFGYYYKGNTALLDIPDAQTKQALAMALKKVMEDYEKTGDWTEYRNRLVELRDIYVSTSLTLNQSRLYQGEVVNELPFPARVRITDETGQEVVAFDLRALETRPYSLPKGRYGFEFRVGPKTATTIHTISSDGWKRRVFPL